MRCFKDDNIVHVAGHINPVEDIDVINTELALADLASVEKGIARYAKQGRQGGDKEALKITMVLEKLQPVLNEGKPARSVKLTDEEKEVIKPLFLLTMKPVMYVANVDDHGFENNPLLEAVKARAATENAPVVAVCAKTEADIADLDDADKEMFLEDMGMKEPGLDRVIRATTCWGFRPTSPPASRKCAPGQFTRAIPLRRPQASFTPTLNAALSVRRPLPTRTTSPLRVKRVLRKRARCALKARTTSSRTAT